MDFGNIIKLEPSEYYHFSLNLSLLQFFLINILKDVFRWLKSTRFTLNENLNENIVFHLFFIYLRLSFYEVKLE